MIAEEANTAKSECEGTADEKGRSCVFSKKLWMKWQLPKRVCLSLFTNTRQLSTPEQSIGPTCARF